MTNAELIRLIKRFSKKQQAANALYSIIVTELSTRGFKDTHDVLDSCLNATEPAGWAEEMLSLIKKEVSL